MVLAKRLSKEKYAMKKRQFPVITVSLLGLVLITVLGAFAGTALIKSQQKDYALDSLTFSKYQSVFLSMYDIHNFSQEDFTTYRGISTLKLNYSFPTAAQVNEAVDTAFSSGNTLTNIYLGLEPYLLWESEGNDILKVREAFENGWFSYVDTFPQISFEVLLPFPSMDYWLSLKEEEVQTRLTLYQQLVGILASRSNITIYFTGDQEWLILNPGNYTGDFAVNESVSQALFLHTFCDGHMQIDNNNSAERLQALSGLISSCRANPAEYPDLSDKEIVFLGDSIIGNYQGSLSIPGVVNALSGATVYNCAIGGTSAAQGEPDGNCFPEMVAEFLSGTPKDADSPFGENVSLYQSDDHTGKKLCFVIDYGRNDYFAGYPVENPEDAYDITTYAGAIRTGIAALREVYPDAAYVLSGPGRVEYFNDGTDVMSAVGSPLVDYYAAALSLSGELDTLYLDLYADFPEAEGLSLSDVLSDGCHYNEYGRFLTGIRFCNILQ